MIWDLDQYVKENKKILIFMIVVSLIEEFPKEIWIYLKTILTSFAYAGSGNATKVQELMHLIASQKEEINPKPKV